MPALSNPRNKDEIVCFRISKSKVQELKRVLDTNKPIGVRSENQMARKVLVDFLDGKLAYATEASRRELVS